MKSGGDQSTIIFHKGTVSLLSGEKIIGGGFEGTASVDIDADGFVDAAGTVSSEVGTDCGRCLVAKNSTHLIYAYSGAVPKVQAWHQFFIGGELDMEDVAAGNIDQLWKGYQNFKAPVEFANSIKDRFQNLLYTGSPKITYSVEKDCFILTDNDNPEVSFEFELFKATKPDGSFESYIEIYSGESNPTIQIFDADIVGSLLWKGKEILSK